MIVVADMLAGGGGTTTGAKMAGFRVRAAINHWDVAIDTHRRNHPEVEHHHEDVVLFDYNRWRRWSLDGLLASPACQGHSKAATRGGSGKRGSAPKHDADRATAWAVATALEVLRTDFACVENVEEFRRWTGYPHWCAFLRDLGYSLHEHVLDAADFGVPCTRVRLFITAVRAASPLVLRLPTVDRVGIGTIFDVKSRSRWKPVARLPKRARARIARARERHDGMMAVRYTSDDVGRSLDEVMGTMTTKHQCAWVRPGEKGDERRMFNSREYLRALGFPEDTQLTGKVSVDCRLLGNAVSPVVMQAICEEIGRRG